MIVDMVRNDLGRVARPGSVRVTNLFDVERYPTVLQLTSTVAAETDASLVDVMRALFPAASITGAPKARTMEIIAGVECSPRRIYTGTIGFVEPGGRSQFNVAIRTVLVQSRDRRGRVRRRRRDRRGLESRGGVEREPHQGARARRPAAVVRPARNAVVDARRGVRRCSAGT